MWGPIKARRLRAQVAAAEAATRDPFYRQFLHSVPLRLDQPWHQQAFLAVDLETTGLDADKDQLIALGWVPITGGRITLAQARRVLVRADTAMNQSATIHGLRDQDLAAGVSLKAAMRELLMALNGRCLVVHYSGLDKIMLDRFCRQLYGAAMPAPLVDTLTLAQRALRHEQTKSSDFRLAALRTRFGLPPASQHDALEDAVATAELFLILVHQLGGKKPLATAQLID